MLTAAPAAMAGRRCLVTGATGFLGRHLCRRLRAEGAEVHAVSRRAHVVAPGAAARWWAVDVADRAAARALVQHVRPDVTFHLGGLVDAAPARALVAPTFDSLLASTVHLLDAVAEAGAGRLVLVGSLEEPDGGDPDVLAPASPYGAAKLAAGVYARMFARLYRTPVVVVRVYMAYGPGQAPTKVIPSAVLALLRHEAPRLSSGERALDWIYVDDVIDGLVRAAARDLDPGTTVEFGSGRAVPIREVVARLVQLVDPSVAPRFGAWPDRPHDRVRVADVERTAAALGWRPATRLADGLAATVAWYRQGVPAGGVA